MLAHYAWHKEWQMRQQNKLCHSRSSHYNLPYRNIGWNFLSMSFFLSWQYWDLFKKEGFFFHVVGDAPNNVLDYIQRIMKCPPVIWAFVLASWAGGGVNGGVHHASIMSKYGQLVTSSTLQWVHANSGPDIPLESVPSGTGNSEKYICRAEHHGALLVGQTSLIGSHCVVGFVNRLYK